MTRVEFIRRKMGLRQRDIAATYGGYPCDISQVEQGFRKPWPRLRRLIAEALGVAEEDLFDREGRPLEVDWSLPREESKKTNGVSACITR